MNRSTKENKEYRQYLYDFISGASNKVIDREHLEIFSDIANNTVSNMKSQIFPYIPYNSPALESVYQYIYNCLTVGYTIHSGQTRFYLDKILDEPLPDKNKKQHVLHKILHKIKKLIGRKTRP